MSDMARALTSMAVQTVYEDLVEVIGQVGTLETSDEVAARLLRHALEDLRQARDDLEIVFQRACKLEGQD
jgi:hypothetical protein